jgi:hypothetical protein
MLEEFKANLGKRGFAKPTMFRVEFTTIPIVVQSKPGIAEIVKDLHFFAETAEFPGTQILTQELRHYDMPAKFAYNKAHDDLNISFRLDRDFQVKKFFDTWINSIYNRETGDVSYKSLYAGGIQIFQIMENGQTSYGIELQEAFPTQLGQISLGWDQAGQYSRLPVTFSFKRMKNITRDKGKDSVFPAPTFGTSSDRTIDNEFDGSSSSDNPEPVNQNNSAVNILKNMVTPFQF